MVVNNHRGGRSVQTVAQNCCSYIITQQCVSRYYLSYDCCSQLTHLSSNKRSEGENCETEEARALIKLSGERHRKSLVAGPLLLLLLTCRRVTNTDEDSSLSGFSRSDDHSSAACRGRCYLPLPPNLCVRVKMNKRMIMQSRHNTATELRQTM